MIPVLEFFANLPRKKCRQCESEMQEQADCYVNICSTCDDPAR